MEITDEDIEHLAILSRLNFTEEELKSFKPQFESIIDYVNQLQTVDISNVEDATRIKTVDDLREDVALPSLTNEEIIMNAKHKAKGAFKVPTVIE